MDKFNKNVERINRYFEKTKKHLDNLDGIHYKLDKLFKKCIECNQLLQGYELEKDQKVCGYCQEPLDGNDLHEL